MAALAVVAIAAVVTPLATGAPPKFYTLTVDKTVVCATPQRQTFTLTLTNESRNNTLGSANITAPTYASLVDGSATVAPNGTATVDTSTNTIMVRALALPTNGSAAITVEADVSIGDGEVWQSIVKQSNDFADSPGPGNLFSLQGDPPPLTVTETCGGGGGGDGFVECDANDATCTDGTTTLLSTIPLLVRFESPDTATCGGTTLTFISQQTFVPDPDDGAFVVTFTYDASISPKQVGATRFCVSKDDGATFQQLLGCEGDQTRLPCVLDRGKSKGALFYKVSFPAGDPKVGMG